MSFGILIFLLKMFYYQNYKFYAFMLVGFWVLCFFFLRFKSQLYPGTILMHEQN